MAEIKTDWVILNVADGATMRSYVARPQNSARHTGLLVFQEAFGVNGHIRDVTERFAREGYVAIAPELFHRTATGFEGAYNNFEAAMPHIRALTDQNLEADVRSAYEWLHADPASREQPIACVGFCMGGRMTFLTNALLPVKAAISFYGGGIAPEQTRAVTEALRAAGKPFVNVEFSDADHGFFCDARSSYNPSAARQAWALALTFLNIYAPCSADL